MRVWVDLEKRVGIRKGIFFFMGLVVVCDGWVDLGVFVNELVGCYGLGRVLVGGR